MPNYAKNLIYKISHIDSSINHIYIGSTCNFQLRYNIHKSSCNKLNSKLYNTIREYGGWSNYKMEVIEYFSCQNKKEATLKEQYYFETLKANLNSICPNRNFQDWYKANEKVIKQKDCLAKNIKYKKDDTFKANIKKKNLERYYVKKEFELYRKILLE